jgi:hypothetical protein
LLGIKKYFMKYNQSDVIEILKNNPLSKVGGINAEQSKYMARGFADAKKHTYTYNENPYYNQGALLYKAIQNNEKTYVACWIKDWVSNLFSNKKTSQMPTPMPSTERVDKNATTAGPKRGNTPRR